MNGYVVKTRIHDTLIRLRRARLRVAACFTAAAAFVTMALAGVVLSSRTADSAWMAWTFVALIAGICLAVWGGWALRSVRQLERRILDVVSSAADRAGPTARAA